MIQFNLLPDVKLEYIKAQYRKRVAIAISLLVTAICLLIFLILVSTVHIAQKQHLKRLDKDIQTSTKTLRSHQDLDKVLTIQNQLKSLPGLHDQKVVSSRLFDYLVQLTPAQASISEVTLDLEAKTINVKGNADSLQTVNKFVDTVKFTKYEAKGNESNEGKAFSSVVLQSFSVADSQGGTGNQEKPNSYEINFSFEPVIFASNKNELDSPDNPVVKLVVPSIISTRSETEKPTLFIPQPAQEGVSR